MNFGQSTCDLGALISLLHVKKQALNVDTSTKFTYKENWRVLGKTISVIQKFYFKIILKNILLNVLSSFAKLRKATTSFFMSVCLHGTAWFPLNGFS